MAAIASHLSFSLCHFLLPGGRNYENALEGADLGLDAGNVYTDDATLLSEGTNIPTIGPTNKPTQIIDNGNSINVTESRVYNPPPEYPTSSSTQSTSTTTQSSTTQSSTSTQSSTTTASTSASTSTQASTTKSTLTQTPRYSTTTKFTEPPILTNSPTNDPTNDPTVVTNVHTEHPFAHLPTTPAVKITPTPGATPDNEIPEPTKPKVIYKQVDGTGNHTAPNVPSISFTVHWLAVNSSTIC